MGFPGFKVNLSFRVFSHSKPVARLAVRTALLQDQQPLSLGAKPGFLARAWVLLLPQPCWQQEPTCGT